MDFDAVSAQANYVHQKMMELRHQVEDLKRDVESMRKVIP